MSEYTINYSIDGWPICKDGEPIFRKKLLLAELQQLQAECERLEAINLGLTKTLVEMEPEKAKLAGALERLVGDAERATHVEFGGTPWLKEKMAEIDYARIALAAYRKQGGEA